MFYLGILKKHKRKPLQILRRSPVAVPSDASVIVNVMACTEKWRRWMKFKVVIETSWMQSFGVYRKWRRKNLPRSQHPDSFLTSWCISFQSFFSEYLRIDKLVMLQPHVRLCRAFHPNKHFLYSFNIIIYTNIPSSLDIHIASKIVWNLPPWVEKIGEWRDYRLEASISPWWLAENPVVVFPMFCAKPLASEFCCFPFSLSWVPPFSWGL